MVKLRSILVFSLVSLMITTTIGVNLQSLYCMCKGDYIVSIFNIEQQCEKNKPKKIKCCSKKLAKKDNTHKDNCCKKESEFVKADIDLISSSVEYPTATFYFADFFHISKHKKGKDWIFVNHLNKPPPLKPYNRILLTRIESFLC